MTNNLPPQWERNNAWRNDVGDPPVPGPSDPDHPEYDYGDNLYIIDQDQTTSVLSAPFVYGQQY